MSLSRAIILASASQTRQRLLVSAGVQFQVIAPGVDESALKARFLSTGEQCLDKLAALLAAAKAVSVSLSHADSLVVGADQILDFEGRVLDKPASMEEARRQLHELRGKTHRLISAVACARHGQVIWDATGAAELSMRAFSDEFLSQYLSTIGEKALSSVGSYQIEGPGIQLFDGFRGDYFTILGLPLLRLLSFLRSEGCLPS
jgi:septum formation protein